MYLLTELNVFSLILLILLWGFGGYLLIQKHFKLPNEEAPLISLGLGLVLNAWVSNWLGRLLPTTYAFWASAGLVIFIGLIVSLPLQIKRPSFNKFPIFQVLFFSVMVLCFTLIGRGFGFFDDHQNLPPVSIMATGDIPPHFAFNPDLMFGYHYFLLLVGSILVRVTGAGPWTALDIARGLTLALTIFLGGFLAYRITKNRFAQIFSIIVILFAGGARWISLLIPASFLRNISSSISLIGTGADSGPNFVTAILKTWKIEGEGPLPIPFMYSSGLDPSFSMFHNGWGTSAIMIVLLLLLLAGIRKSTFISWLPFVVLLSSLALANEVTFAFLYVGFVLSAAYWSINHRSIKLLFADRGFLSWLAVFVVAGIFALVQGGMLSEIFFGFFKKSVASPTDTYFKVSFTLSLPAILSSHLGSLSLLNPYHWLPILGETGLVIFALPLVVKEIPSSIKKNEWLESAWIMSLFVSLFMIFFQYTGNAGPTAISRMQAHFLSVVKVLAVPLVWLWVKKYGEDVKLAVFGWGVITVFSGIALFGVQMAAMTQPVYAIFLNNLDGQMFQRNWDTLRPDTMVFDHVYPRSATIFGRPIRSSKTMGETLPAWNKLNKKPDPILIHQAGYDYFYSDLRYLLKYKSVIKGDCMQQVDKIEVIEKGKLLDGRYLFDISTCD
jgi:hypothetical protein